MKYILFDELKNDLYVDEFKTKLEAIKESRKIWNGLSEQDKDRREHFYIIKSANPDVEAEDHWDAVEIVRIWK